MSSTPVTRPILTRQQARDFYDRFGRRQDRQAFYEKVALDRLIELGDFGSAEAIVEFGCGTGKFAQQLMEEHVQGNGTYIGFDLSETMVQLTRKRLVPFGVRASVVRTDGRPRVPLPPTSCDRFVSTYVLDLLSNQDISRTLAQAWKVLRPGGLLCLTGLTYGTTLLSRWVVAAWLAVHSLRPSLVGGCRPISLTDFLGPASWKVLYSTTLVAWGVPSEVLIARPRAHAQPGAGIDRLIDQENDEELGNEDR
jgi:SAM-dependent methyltransferase